MKKTWNWFSEPETEILKVHADIWISGAEREIDCAREAIFELKKNGFRERTVGSVVGWFQRYRRAKGVGRLSNRGRKPKPVTVNYAQNEVGDLEASVIVLLDGIKKNIADCLRTVRKETEQKYEKRIEMLTDELQALRCLREAAVNASKYLINKEV